MTLEQWYRIGGIVVAVAAVLGILRRRSAIVKIGTKNRTKIVVKKGGQVVITTPSLALLDAVRHPGESDEDLVNRLLNDGLIARERRDDA